MEAGRERLPEAHQERPGHELPAVRVTRQLQVVARVGRGRGTAWLVRQQHPRVHQRGRVVSAGKLLTVCAADVFAVDAAGKETLCATLLGTARNIKPA